LEGLGAPAADRDYKPGHARMQALLAGMRLRRPALRIRIAGTNGKGSTAAMLAAGLAAADLSVGLYTSPHIHRFNERIRVDGCPVDDTVLLSLLPSIVEQAGLIGASYFEVATALALQCFSDAGVDVEILEAGVGARLDATTAVPADMALLTPVALDHQSWLGDTLTAIADEKVHVFDGCRWCLSAVQAAEVRAVVDGKTEGVAYTAAALHLHPCMPGAHQQLNAGLALAGLDTLSRAGSIFLTRPDAEQAVCAARIDGRLQEVHLGGQVFWLDAAHNRHAAEALQPTLSGMAPFDAIFVFTREDRDLSDALPLLRSLTHRLISGRPACAADVCYTSVVEALEKETDRDGGRFLVLGSFITVAAASDWLAARGGLL